MILFFSAMLAALACVSCATVDRLAASPADLRKAADTYWGLRIAGKYAEAYRMEDDEGLPEYGDYVSRMAAFRKLEVTSHAIKNTTVDDDRGIVEVELKMRVPHFSKPMKQAVVDRWAYKAGRWLHKF